MAAGALKKNGNNGIRLAVFLAAAGTAVAVAAGMALARFIRTFDFANDPPVSHFVRGLILPHVVMLLGIGIAFYGAILIGRRSVYRRRLRDMEDERNPGS